MKLNLAEELLLLALKDEKGSFAMGKNIFQIAAAGALLMELLIEERISVFEKKVVVNNPSIHSDPFLNEALLILQSAKKPRKVKDWVQILNSKMKGLIQNLLDSLVAKGILKHEEGKILWVFPDHRFPTDDAGPEQGIRQDIYDVVLAGSSPDPRTATLISLILSCDLTNEIFEKPDRSAAKKRMKKIAKEFKDASPVHHAIAEAQAAVAVTVVAVVAAAGSSG